MSYRTEHRERKLPLVPVPWEDSFLPCPKAPTPFPLGQLFPLSLPLAGLGFFSAFWSRLRKCFHSIRLLCSWPTGSRGPDESPFSPYMAKPCAVQPGQFYGAVMWGARAFVDTGHRVPPKTQARWRVGAGYRLPPLDPIWGLGRECDQLCGPAYPYCVRGDLVPGVSLLAFLVVLRCKYLSHSECLLWVLGKITSEV